MASKIYNMRMPTETKERLLAVLARTNVDTFASVIKTALAFYDSATAEGAFIDPYTEVIIRRTNPRTKKTKETKLKLARP